MKKYKTKYKILYQTLQQAINRSKIPSSRVSSPELIPSLVALEDAATLKRKEWDRDKPDIEKPHMFSTKGRLTPTVPAYEDMRTATPSMELQKNPKKVYQLLWVVQKVNK